MIQKTQNCNNKIQRNSPTTRSLIDILKQHAIHIPKKTAFIYLDAHQNPIQTATFSELYTRSQQIAQLLFKPLALSASILK